MTNETARDWPVGDRPCLECDVARGQRHMRYCSLHPDIWDGTTQSTNAEASTPPHEQPDP